MADARIVLNPNGNRAIVEQAIKMRENARRTVERRLARLQTEGVYFVLPEFDPKGIRGMVMGLATANAVQNNILVDDYLKTVFRRHKQRRVY